MWGGTAPKVVENFVIDGNENELNKNSFFFISSKVLDLKLIIYKIRLSKITKFHIFVAKYS